jgi:alkaline phosphatase
MFASDTLDLLAGAGHPAFDNDGLPASPRYNRVPEALWLSLKAGAGVSSHTTVDGRGFTVDASRWQLVESKAAIQALARGSEAPADGKRLAMIAQVYDALQYHRAGASRDENAFATPFLETVPTLADLASASLRHLGSHRGGFFLMIEGGAVDWAMHANQMGRMIEEQIDFHHAVQAVIDYLDKNTDGNNWGNTLVVITADHDHLLYGPDSGDSQPFQLVQPDDPHDEDNLPQHRWHSSHHGNQLVPAWFRGAGAGEFAGLADKVDPYLTEEGGFNPVGDGRTRYIGQDDIGRKLMELLGQPAAGR